MSANQQTAQANADATKQAADKAAAEKAAADKAATDKANAAGGNVPPTLESIQRKLDLADAKNELLESGRASKVEAIRALQIETLADCKDPARRKSLLESWPKPDAKALKEGRQPRPFERPDASPPASGTADGGAGEMSESLKASLDRRQKTLQEGKIPQRV